MTESMAARAQDSVPQSGGAAYVARPEGPPDTAVYMWGGYAVGLVVIGAYVLLLLRRLARERSQG
jgi:nitrate reductase gamma subunit